MFGSDEVHLIEIVVLVEKDVSGEIIGKIETLDFIIFSTGKTINELRKDLEKSVSDFLENEGSEREEWQDYSIDNIKFIYEYTVTNLFKVFDVFHLEKFSTLSNIDQNLLQNLASNNEKSTIEQCKKIEMVIHELGKYLQEVIVV